MRYPRRGDIYLVNFDPTVGAEIQKTRPALILQNDIGNRTSDITIVAAVSSQLKGKRYPFEVIVPTAQGGLTANSRILLNHIRYGTRFVDPGGAHPAGQRSGQGGALPLLIRIGGDADDPPQLFPFQHLFLQ